MWVRLSLSVQSTPCTDSVSKMFSNVLSEMSKLYSVSQSFRVIVRLSIQPENAFIAMSFSQVCLCLSSADVEHRLQQAWSWAQHHSLFLESDGHVAGTSHYQYGVIIESDCRIAGTPRYLYGVVIVSDCRVAGTPRYLYGVAVSYTHLTLPTKRIV